MPKVPEYSRQLPYQDPRVDGPRLSGMSVQSSADMFGADSARGLGHLGRGIMDAANTFAHVYDDYNTTAARDAANKMQQGFLAWQSEAQKKQGQDGINTAADYDAWAKETSQGLSKDMNDIQRARFESLSGRHMAAQRHWAEGYGQQQDQVYKRATWQAELTAAGDMLATNIQNPGLAEQAIEQVKDAAFSLGKNMGIGDTATQELMRQSLAKSLSPAIHAKIQAGETALAATLIKQYQGQLGGSAVAQLGAELKREQKRQQAEARMLAAESRREKREQSVNLAYRTLYDMTPEEAQAAAMNPNWQQSMGLTADMAKDAVSMLHTMRNWQLDAQKQERQQYEKDLYTNTVNMALGVNGAQQDPVKAIAAIQNDPKIDGKTKMDMLNAVQNNLINAHDDAFFVSDLRARIIQTDGAVPDNEILQGVATGKVKQATAENLFKLRELAQGGNSPVVKTAFSALNEMFRKSMMADGTPEQAAAHLAAQRQLQADIDAARQSGNSKEIDRVTSPDHIAAIGKKFTLSMQDQQSAALGKLKQGVIKPNEASKQVSAPSPSPSFESGISQDSRLAKDYYPPKEPGETIDQYRKRIGME